MEMCMGPCMVCVMPWSYLRVDFLVNCRCHLQMSMSVPVDTPVIPMPAVIILLEVTPALVTWDTQGMDSIAMVWKVLAVYHPVVQTSS